MSDLGHNQPPPVEVHGMHINDLYDEAKQWLDGDPIANEEQAQGVAKLLDALRLAGKEADKQRAAEKKPHDDAGKAVQEAWKPLLAKCELAASTAKNALAPYIEAKEAQQRAEAARLHQEAQAKADEARRAAEASRGDDLMSNAAVEGLVKDAAKALKDAERADKVKASVAGGARAVSLRTYYTPELTDAKSALAFYMREQPDALKAWIIEQAARDIAAGRRKIPGIVVHEEKRAV